jgi:PAS domain S-box-containing protein
MPGNSQRKGAVRRKGKGNTAGSGGRVRRGLEGRGPTPKAEDRPYHAAHKAKKAAARSRPATSSGPRTGRPGSGPEWVAGRNAVLESMTAEIPVKAAYIAEGAERDDRLRDILKLAADRSTGLLEVTRAELDRLTGGAVHQGVALQLPTYAYAHPDDLLAAALAADTEPLIVADLRHEPGADSSRLLLEHGAVSGALAAIGGGDAPFGALVAFAANQRLFTPEDARLVLGIASFLGEALARAEPDRRLARGHLHLLARNSADIVTLVDRDGVILYQSPAVARVLGLDPDRQVGESVFTSPPPHPDDLPALRAALGAALAEPGADVRASLRLRHAAGSWRWFDAVLVNLHDDPHARGVVLTLQDVTAHTQAEAKFRGLLESAPDAIVTVDGEGRIVLTNSQAERLFGYPARELIGQPVETLIPERLRGRHERHRAEYARQPRTRPMGVGLELVGRRKDGTEFPAEISLSPLQSEDGLLFTSVIRDVTERKRSEEGLRFLAEASRLLASSLEYETTLQAVARLATPALAHWCVVELLGEDGVLRLAAAAHSDPAREGLLRAGEGARPGGPEVVTRVLRTGRSAMYSQPAAGVGGRRDVSASYICAQLIARGRALGALTLASEEVGRYGVRDLALAEELARRAAVAVDNARLYREARSAVRTRDDFIATVTHDLKNPLGAIKLHAELARVRASAGGAHLAEPVGEELGKIVAAVAQTTAQLDELLDVARLQAGRPLELERRLTDLVALARRVLDEHQQTTGRHRLRLQAESGSLEGRWDPVRLERAVANLVSNAILYSPEGGEVEVEVCREAASGGACAVLCVRDEGLGIPAQDLPHVFERFRRGSNVARHFRGTGLGLASARQVVEQHGGSIAVSSREGEGSAFTVRLPLDC